MSTGYIKHNFAPVFDEHSVVLILGTMPSPKSREHGFYYSNPQNRFWTVLGLLFGEKTPETVEEKKSFLLFHHIALWDVLAECEIIGAADSSIRNPLPNDIAGLLEKTNIRAVFTTGKTAATLLDKFFPELPCKVFNLPSTSPANARMGVDALAEKYREIIRYL